MLSAMPLKFFIVPVLDAAPAEAEINAFLARHRVVAIDRRWVDQGSSSLWAICVDYFAAGSGGSMDDLVLWGDDQEDVIARAERCRAFLQAELGLDFKPARPRPAAQGLDFLGCRIYPTHTTLSRRSRGRYRRRVRLLTRAFRPTAIGTTRRTAPTTWASALP